jgi:hypothetical protein
LLPDCGNISVKEFINKYRYPKRSMVVVLHTQLHYATVNSLLIIVCMLLIVWCFKAIKRFSRSLTVRHHMIRGHNDVIEIPGLGSFLSYFEDVSRMHIHSLVHTRQTKPAILMSSVFVPVSLNRVQLVTIQSESKHGSHVVHRTGHATHDQSIHIDVSLTVTTAGRLLLLSKFNLQNFTSALHQSLQTQLDGRATATSNYLTSINFLRRTIFNVDLTRLPPVSGHHRSDTVNLAEPHVAEWLQSKESMEHAYGKDIAIGKSVVRFDLSSIQDRLRRL